METLQLKVQKQNEKFTKWIQQKKVQLKTDRQKLINPKNREEKQRLKNWYLRLYSWKQCKHCDWKLNELRWSHLRVREWVIYCWVSHSWRVGKGIAALSYPMLYILLIKPQPTYIRNSLNKYSVPFNRLGRNKSFYV